MKHHWHQFYDLIICYHRTNAAPAWPSTCEIHTGRSIEYFCEDDKVAICSYCVVMGDHKNHIITTCDEKVIYYLLLHICMLIHLGRFWRSSTINIVIYLFVLHYAFFVHKLLSLIFKFGICCVVETLSYSLLKAMLKRSCKIIIVTWVQTRILHSVSNFRVRIVI